MGAVALCLVCELAERGSCIQDSSTCTQGSSDSRDLNWFLPACLHGQKVKYSSRQQAEVVKYDHLDILEYNCTYAEYFVFQWEAQAPVSEAKVVPE